MLVLFYFIGELFGLFARLVSGKILSVGISGSNPETVTLDAAQTAQPMQ